MKVWWKYALVAAVVLGIGVVCYVGIKKVLGSFMLPDVSAVQQQIDELVDDLERARNDLSGLRDSLGDVKDGLSELEGQLGTSIESADRLGVRIRSSINRQRELEGILEESQNISGIFAEGIGRNEAALLRLREYLDSYEEGSGD